MKYVLIFFLVSIFVSCNRASKSVVPPWDAVVLKLHEKTTYENLVITLTQVAESRCPMNARCIRAGEAVATINVVAGSDRERNIQLCTGSDCGRRGLSDSYPVSGGTDAYLFRLDSITPDPTRTLEKGDTRVYLSITQD